MSTTTTNLELVKPAGNERVDVDVINSNYDKIDEFAGLAITDANYVHTDNNYTTTEKNKLSAIQPNATATSFTQTLVSGTAVGTITINGTAYTIYAPAASGGSSALNDLSDVTLASPSNGQVLKYNATTGKWENANESGGGGGYIPTGEVYTFFTDGSAAAANYTLYVQWTDGETVTTALIVSYSELISGWTTDDYQDVTINWDSSNQNFNFVAKSGSFECNGTYFDEGDTMGTLSSGNITFNAMEKEATGVDWTQVQLSGTKIAEIEIDGVSQNVYSPTPPTKTSDLTNDSNFVADASYVHTDNNYTLTEKNKLSGLVEVEANPSGTASTDLTKIAIGGTNYNIPSGGSGSSTFAGLSDVDIDDATLANGQVPVWNSTTEKWENGAGGGGGHTILNDNGTPLAQESNLQFRGAYSRDDSTNEKTVVEVVRSMTKAEFDQLTSAEKTGIINVTDEEERPWKEVTGVLTAGQTEIILSDDAITVNSTFEAFTDPIEVSHTDMVLVNEPTLLNDILTGEDNTKVTASSIDTSAVPPWKAFDGIKGVSSNTYVSPYYSWLAGNGDAPCWLQYHFATAKYIDEVKIYVYCNNGTHTGSAKIQGSNDGITWTDISSAVSISAPYGEEIELDFTCDGNQYSYVRLYSESAFAVHGGASIFVGEMEIYGRNSAYGVKVIFPAQTENINVKVRVS